METMTTFPIIIPHAEAGVVSSVVSSAVVSSVVLSLVVSSVVSVPVVVSVVPSVAIVFPGIDQFQCFSVHALRMVKFSKNKRTG